ncbi:MAG: D-glycero-beta-D-manno-heptose-7-phosphate kinase [Simkania sp.]|nr:D-glycero-beta-D-manno-heptose-7-phosphate kinase [Simkania sp.]
MVKLIGSFSQLKPARILVVGDFMLDTYTTGRVQRISPEAPVPILHVKETQHLPGGAGNVVLNLKALGASVVCVGRIGPDIEGKRLKSLLEAEAVDTAGLFVQKATRTPVKNRLIAGSQQLMRVDDETLISIDQSVEKKVLSYINTQLDEIEVIAVSDYGKGFLSKTLLAALIQEGNKRKIPILVDPKGDDFSRYTKATMIKPNFKEAVEAAKLGSDATLDEVGHKLVRMTQTKHIIVTRSEAGISLFDNKKQRFDFPVKVREVIDVTGAGDTVLAVTAMAYAADLDLKEGLHLANVAASIAIERLGCVRVSLSDIAERLLETDVVNKVFDEHHLFALEQALKNKKLTILGLSSKEDLSAALFAKIQTLALADSEGKLMIYLTDEKPDEHFVALLSSLHEVDYIVLKSDSLSSLCEKIHPARVFSMDGKNLLSVDHHHDLVSV